MFCFLLLRFMLRRRFYVQRSMSIKIYYTYIEVTLKKGQRIKTDNKYRVIFMVSHNELWTFCPVTRRKKGISSKSVIWLINNFQLRYKLIELFQATNYISNNNRGISIIILRKKKSNLKWSFIVSYLSPHFVLFHFIDNV